MTTKTMECDIMVYLLLRQSTEQIELQLDKLNEKWFDARRHYGEALAKEKQKATHFYEQMEQIKREQVRIIAKHLGFEVEFPEDMKRVDSGKFWLKKRKRYRALAFFDGGRLRTIIKAKRPDTMRYSYLINGQALRGCENIYCHF